MKTRVKINQQVFEVEIENLNSRPILAKVDGQTFEVWPEETAVPQAAAPVATPAPAPVSAPVAAPAAPAAEAAPAAKPASHGVTANKSLIVSAPIPGVIISITVKEGEEVKAGQELCILEAMKMKNTIRASRAGTIAAIHVNPGENVKHNQALMEFAA